MPSISYQEHVNVSLEVIVLDSSMTLESIVEGLNNGKFSKSIVDSLIYNEAGKAIAQIIDVDESDIVTDVFIVESEV